MKQLFFVHIPKTAGTSLIAGLMAAGYGSCYFVRDEHFLPLLSKAWLAQQKLLAGHVLAATAEACAGQTHALFSMVRHPADVLLSAYSYVRGRPPECNTDPASRMLADLDLKGWLARHAELDNVFHSQLVYLGAPRLDVAHYPLDALLANARRFAARRWVGRVEDMAPVLDYLARAAGQPVVLPRANLTEELGPRLRLADLAPDQRRQLMAILEPDLVLYDYLAKSYNGPTP
jgi:hypothetical protein